MPVNELTRALRTAIGAGERLGIAVSGGSDSMALLHLSVAAGLEVEAATVDHRLRPDSAAEARTVAGVCASLGVPHETLVWEHAEIQGNIQDQARRARYRLLAGWARDRAIPTVAVAHTLDDQAETVVMALMRAGGVDALAGMRPRWDERGVSFVRPLLGVRRETLREYLRENGVAWIEDPSNADTRYERVRVRAALSVLGDAGVTPEALARTARNLAETRDALDAAVLAASGATAEADGGLLLSRAALRSLPAEVRRRLLDRALRWVSGTDLGPRGEPLQRLIADLLEGKGGTLHGCVVRVADDRVTIAPESGPIERATDFRGAIIAH